MTAELTANGGPDAGNVLAGGRSPDMAISQHKLPCSGAQCSTKHLEVDNGIYKMSISRKIASLDCMDALRSALFLPLENASTSICKLPYIYTSTHFEFHSFWIYHH